jgi:hypothetical protein
MAGLQVKNAVRNSAFSFTSQRAKEQGKSLQPGIVSQGGLARQALSPDPIRLVSLGRIDTLCYSGLTVCDDYGAWT